MNDDYYEWEMHIFFDDAFKLNECEKCVKRAKEVEEKNDCQKCSESVPNKYVEFLLKSVQDEGLKWYSKKFWGSGHRHPERYETPYGGRLVWTLPGTTQVGNSIIVSPDGEVTLPPEIKPNRRKSCLLYFFITTDHLPP